MPDIGPIHTLERQTSICTNQGGEGTCYAHSTAKLFLQNIYIFTIPIHVTYIEKFHSCFDGLTTDIENANYTDLSVTKCGNGYRKILCFLYLYFVIKPRKLLPLNEMIRIVVEMPDLVDQIPEKNRTDLDMYRDQLHDIIGVRGLKWDNFYILCTATTIPFLNDIIIPILELGFYIEIVLQNITLITDVIDDIKPPHHSAIIVGHREHLGQNFFGIANSWGKTIDNTNDITLIHLGTNLYTPLLFLFVLPFCTKEGPYSFPTLEMPVPTLEMPLGYKQYSSESDMERLVEWIPEYCDDIETLNDIKVPSGGKKKRNTKDVLANV